MIYSWKNIHPQIAKGVFIADSADIIGDVHIEANASVWFNCTLRGDGQKIAVGEYSNIQDNTVVHVAVDDTPTIIKKHVTVGHSAVIHACTLEDYAFVGMGATILNNAIVKSFGFVAAGALVPPNFIVPEKTLVAGVPARIIRKLNESEIKMIKESSIKYAKNADGFNESLTQWKPV